MPHRLYPPPVVCCLRAALLIAALAALAGCAAGRVVTRVEVSPCPPAPLAVACPDMPPPGATLRSLLSAWADAQAVHAACRSAVAAWETAWQACRQGEGGD